MSQCSSFPSSASSGDVWEQWHKNLVKCVGRGKANDLFLLLWQKRAGASAAASTIRLRTYMGEQGVELTVDGWKKSADFFSGVGDFLGGGIAAFGTGVKILWYGLIGILVIGGLGLVYTIFVNPDAAVRAGSAIATKGKSEALMAGTSSSPRVSGGSPKMIDVKAK